MTSLPDCVRYATIRLYMYLDYIYIYKYGALPCMLHRTCMVIYEFALHFYDHRYDATVHLPRYN